MNAALPLLGAASEAARRIVLRDALAAPCVFARPQVGSLATVAGANGIWSESLANVARFVGAGQRLLIEGQRTNHFANPRGEGAVVGLLGAGGSWPTGWGGGAVFSGLSLEVVGQGVASGMTYTRLRLSGTSDGTASRATSSYSAPATLGQPVTNGVFSRLVSGSAAGLSVQVEVREYAGGSPGAVSGASLPLATSWGRGVISRVMTDPATTSGRYTTRFSGSNGVAYDVVFDIANPSIEAAPFASTPILPPVGTPFAATRGADRVTAGLAGLGIGANGAGTFLWSGAIAQTAPAGQDQTILQVDGGASTEAFALVNLAGGTQIALRRVLAGVATQLVLGSVAAGTDFRLGMALDGTGRAIASLNGGTAAEVTGGAVGGFTTLRVGSDATGDRALFGETAAVATRGFALPASALPRAVAALPN